MEQNKGEMGVCGLPGRKGNVTGTQNSSAKKPRGPLREKRMETVSASAQSLV